MSGLGGPIGLLMVDNNLTASLNVLPPFGQQVALDLFNDRLLQATAEANRTNGDALRAASAFRALAAAPAAGLGGALSVVPPDLPGIGWQAGR